MFAGNALSVLQAKNKTGQCIKIDCAECDQAYIGETTVRLGDRNKQHRNDIAKMHIRESTALVGHAKRWGHQFKFDEVKILHQENIQAKPKIHELNQIILHRNTACNYKSDSAHVNPAYYNLIMKTTTNNSRNVPNNYTNVSVTNTSTANTNTVLSSTRIDDT